MKRHHAVLMAALLACLAAAGCGRTAEAAPGDEFPAVAGLRASGPRLVWVLRPQDFLRCTTAASYIRKFQARRGEQVPLTVVFVGEHPEWARAFLRRQRLRADVVEMDGREYEERFGRRAGARMHVLEGRTVRGVAPTGDFARLERLLAVDVERVLADRGSAGHTDNDKLQETR